MMLRCLWTRHGFRGVAENSSPRAASNPSCPSVTSRSTWVAPRLRMSCKTLSHPSLSSSAQARPRQYFLLPFEIDSQHRQNDARFAFAAMADLEMDAIEVHYAPMRLQRTLTPDFKVVGQALIQTTDGAGTGSDSHQSLSYVSHGYRVLAPATNICVNPSAICGASRRYCSKVCVWNWPARSRGTVRSSIGPVLVIRSRV
jgi:hypothetical protein